MLQNWQQIEAPYRLRHSLRDGQFSGCKKRSRVAPSSSAKGGAAPASARERKLPRGSVSVVAAAIVARVEKTIKKSRFKSFTVHGEEGSSNVGWIAMQFRESANDYLNTNFTRCSGLPTASSDRAAVKVTVTNTSKLRLNRKDRIGAKLQGRS